jgi:protoheme IX farnesyltransferase
VRRAAILRAERASPSFTTLLAGTTMSVYLLVMIGATAAITDIASVCPNWPLCRGPIDGPTIMIAWGHRLFAAVTGLLVLWVAVAAVTSDGISRRVKATVVAGLALYPLQIAMGAYVVAGGVPLLSSAHLLVGMAIFGAFVLALAWHLEAETAEDDHEGVVDPEPAPLPDDDADAPAEPSYRALTGLDRVTATGLAYFRLMKPRLMWLLCLVAAAGMTLAAGQDLAIRTIVLTLGGGVLSIGASGTFNHVLERDIDKRMDRTSDRPVATHQIPVRNAVAFGLALTVISLGLFAQVNLLTAALGFTAILFYSVIYTLLLKPNTVQNTVIGGAAGALPALIGWGAVTGTIGLPGLALAALIFLWTPAHFYNLALAYKDDYERGGFPMMPVVHGESTTRKHIVYYLGATLLGAIALAAVTSLGWAYAATATALGGAFLWAVIRLHRDKTDKAAFRAFHASNAYLGLVLLAIVVDALAV